MKPLMRNKLDIFAAIADFSNCEKIQFWLPELLIVCNSINDLYAINIRGIMDILNSKNKSKTSLNPNFSTTVYKLMENVKEVACIDHDKQFIASSDFDVVLTAYDTNN